MIMVINWVAVRLENAPFAQTNAKLLGKVIEPRPNFEHVVRSNFREQIRLVFSPAAVYEVTYPLDSGKTCESRAKTFSALVW